ncbi:MAG: histone deacetylase family protein [Anaerolineae bacterium]|nr:histone deacetylase family protein [Anaerolineae bacterium]
MDIVYTRRHKAHATDAVGEGADGFEFLEVPARAEVILTVLQAEALGPVISPSDFGLAPILDVHAAEYVDFLRTAYARNVDYLGRPAPVLAGRPAVTAERPAQRPSDDDFPALRDYYTFDYEDPILEGTWDAAYWAAQCALTAAVRVQGGERVAYALCRPPGHHATADQYGGFCYLNNVAVATRFMQRPGGSRAAILDLDYHHGNGTQSIFYADPDVLYCSLHADPAEDYPHYWGYASERGDGAGLGTVHNYPLPLFTEDVRYLAALDRALATIADFAPQFLLVSLGLDIAEDDLIGKFYVTRGGIAEIARRVAALDLPTLLVQEGGYNLETLGQNVATFLREFSSG